MIVVRDAHQYTLVANAELRRITAKCECGMCAGSYELRLPQKADCVYGKENTPRLIAEEIDEQVWGDGCTITYMDEQGEVVISQNGRLPVGSYTVIMTAAKNAQVSICMENYIIAPARLRLADARIDDVIYRADGKYAFHAEVVFSGLVDQDKLTEGEDYIIQEIVLKGENEPAENVPAAVTIQLLNGSYTLGANSTFDAAVNILAHVHQWAYHAEGATLIATCTGEACADNVQSITIATPADLVYSGDPKEVSLLGGIDGVANPAVMYEGDRINVTAEGFTARITLGEADNQATAMLRVVLEKATINRISMSVAAPEAGQAPQTNIAAGEGYSGTIQWDVEGNAFDYDTAYTATVVLMADSCHTFGSDLAVPGWTVCSNEGTTVTLTKTFENTVKPTPMVTAIATPEPTPTATATATLEPTPTATATASPESTPTATATPEPTPTATVTPEPTPTATATATMEPTPTVTATATPEPTPTATATATPEPTSTATATAEPAPTVTVTATPEPTLTATATATPAVTPIPPPTVTPEVVLTPEPITLPMVIQPTADQTATPVGGEQLMLTVYAINGDRCQWYVDRNDGQGYKPVSGATEPTLTIEVTQWHSGYRYICRISNAFGVVDSPAFILEVLPALDVPVTGDQAQLGTWMALLLLTAAGLLLMQKCLSASKIQ